MKKLLLTLLATGLPLGAAYAQQAATVVLPMTYLGESAPLYNLSLKQQRTLSMRGLMPPTEMAQKHGPLIEEIEGAKTGRLTSAGAVSESAVQTSASQPLVAAAGANFIGPGTGMPGFTMTGAPPDTTLAVGPSHVVAWVNSMYAMMDKSGNVLALANGNVLFAGTGNLCDTTNRGDPILQYDKLANRWVMSQFAFNYNSSTGNITPPYLQCIAVSTTNNPLGTYNRYVITFSSVSPNGFNDYGKLGIFPDGYYTSYNVFGGNPAGSNTGAALCASDRVKMLAGDPTATTLCAPTTFYGGGASLLPMDVDGTTAPTTTAQGNIFIRQSTAPALRLLKLKPDFVAATVTITDGLGGAANSFVNLALGTTTRACNGAAGACVEQLGTTNKLDTLADRLMYRAVYRNRGGVDSLIVTQSVDPDGAGTRGSAVRWYEIRSPFSATPTLFQNATFDQGGSGDRWMASIAMDKMGNMLMGYSYSNPTAGVKPSINVTGRYRTDLRNQMRAEQTMYAGTGSQTGTLTRWGDYTTMQIDPSDDCTFWYIGQYLPADGTFNWSSRIANYKFAGCS